MRYKVFLSSTFDDLKEHRRNVIDLLRTSGFDVDPMEDWPADASEPKTFSRDGVVDCDLMILLVARRRGFIPDDETRSITQLEYDCAVENKIDVLPFLLDDEALWHRKYDELDTDPKVVAWREYLRKQRGVEFFDHISENLGRAVSTSLSRCRAAQESKHLTPLPAQSNQSNLPAPDTAFIGRAVELEQLRELFLDDNAHLVTVIGPGGIGKTRLSLELARQLCDHFDGGCWFVDVSSAETETGLGAAVAESFRINLTGAEPATRVIGNMLGARKPTLLVLDNFEQVVQHAEATLGAWRRAADRVRFLVTSRTALNLSSEIRYSLSPLPLPPPGPVSAEALDKIAANEAVRLFVDQASRKERDFHLDRSSAAAIVKICRQVECSPLSIVLIANHITTHTPQEMAEELATFETTLWTPLRWSYQRLASHVQQAFQQVCVFREGFDREAARAVIELSDAPAGEDAIGVVGRLCDHSFLRSENVQGRKRFHMYNKTIQDFGQSLWNSTKGVRTPPVGLARRWIEHYLKYAEHWDAKINTKDCRPALDRLVEERENILAVHQWAVDHAEVAIAARIILAYAKTLTVRGPAVLRIPHLTDTLCVLGDQDNVLRARLLIELSNANFTVSLYDQAKANAQEAAELAEKAGDLGVLAYALRSQGRVRGYQGGAYEWYYERSIAIFEKLGDERGIALNRISLGHRFEYAGDRVESLAQFSLAEQTFRTLDDPMSLANALNSKGLVIWRFGDPGKALACFEQAEAINRDLGDIGWVGGHLTNRGLALTDLRRPDEALACFEEAGKCHECVGNRAWTAVNLGGRGRALIQQGNNEEAVRILGQAEQIAEDVSYPQDIAMHAGDRGRALISLGRTEEAGEALNKAIAIQQRISESHTIRYCGNLIQLALVERHRGDANACHEYLDQASTMAESLGMTPQSPSRNVRDDVALLNEMRQWVETHATDGIQ